MHSPPLAVRGFIFQSPSKLLLTFVSRIMPRSNFSSAPALRMGAGLFLFTQSQHTWIQFPGSVFQNRFDSCHCASTPRFTSRNSKNRWSIGVTVNLSAENLSAENLSAESRLVFNFRGSDCVLSSFRLTGCDEQLPGSESLIPRNLVHSQYTVWPSQPASPSVRIFASRPGTPNQKHQIFPAEGFQAFFGDPMFFATTGPY